MRTTLTLDDDVAIQLEKRRREMDTTMRKAVNDVLRRGLATTLSKPNKTRFETKTADVGTFRVPMLDCYGEMLDFMEAAERRENPGR